MNWTQLLRARAEESADLGALGLGLIGLVHRTFDLCANRIRLGAKMIQRRPVLVFSDQQVVRVIRSLGLMKPG
jgi:hypothetical protein